MHGKPHNYDFRQIFFFFFFLSLSKLSQVLALRPLGLFHPTISKTIYSIHEILQIPCYLWFGLLSLIN